MTRGSGSAVRGRRPVSGVAVALAVSAVLAGCGGLPVHSAVRIERPIVPGAGVGLGIAPARVLPPGPREGASPTAIVSGFLNAQADSDDDYATAHTFLAPDATWSVSGAVTIYAAVTTAPDTIRAPAVASAAPTTTTVSPPSPEGSTTTVRATLRLVASLDAQGTYAPNVGTRVVEIPLRVVNGQWRITAVAPGVALTIRDLQRSYEAETLWWFAPRSPVLVPEVRWFPSAPAALPTVLAKALLAGPQSGLGGVLRSALPDGVALRGSATVIGADVLVDLDRRAAGLTAEQASNVLRQFALTLGQVPGVSGVRLTVDGAPLPLPGLPARVATSFANDVDPDQPAGWAAYVPRILGAERIGPGKVIGAVAALSKLPLERLATSPDGSSAAGLVRLRSGLVQAYVATGAGPAVALGSPGALRSLSFDRAGELLVGGDRLVRYDAARRPSEVTVDALPGTARSSVIEQALLSGDGERVALVAGAPGATALWVGQLRAEAPGLHLVGLHPIAPALAEVRSATWSTSTSLTVLATGPAAGTNAAPGAVELWDLSLDGSGLSAQTLTPAVTGMPESVTSAAGAAALVGAAGRIYERTATGLRFIGRGSFPAYPG